MAEMNAESGVAKRFLIGAVVVWFVLIAMDAVYTVAKARSDPHFAPELGPRDAFILFGTIFSIAYFIVAGAIAGLLAFAFRQ